MLPVDLGTFSFSPLSLQQKFPRRCPEPLAPRLEGRFGVKRPLCRNSCGGSGGEGLFLGRKRRVSGSQGGRGGTFLLPLTPRGCCRGASSPHCPLQKLAVGFYSLPRALPEAHLPGFFNYYYYFNFSPLACSLRALISCLLIAPLQSHPLGFAGEDLPPGACSKGFIPFPHRPVTDPAFAFPTPGVEALAPFPARLEEKPPLKRSARMY